MFPGAGEKLFCKEDGIDDDLSEGSSEAEITTLFWFPK
jgi:hypothetical protein